LFLPAAGARDSYGEVRVAGSGGEYYANRKAGDNGVRLEFGANTVTPNIESKYDEDACTVRCVMD
jgi:hypothetical protein